MVREEDGDPRRNDHSGEGDGVEEAAKWRAGLYAGDWSRDFADLRLRLKIDAELGKHLDVI